MNFSRYIYLSVFLFMPFVRAMDNDSALQAALLASLGADATAVDVDMLAALAASLDDGAMAAPVLAARPAVLPAAAPAPHAASAGEPMNTDLEAALQASRREVVGMSLGLVGADLTNIAALKDAIFTKATGFINLLGHTEEMVSVREQIAALFQEGMAQAIEVADNLEEIVCLDRFVTALTQLDELNSGDVDALKRFATQKSFTQKMPSGTPENMALTLSKLPEFIERKEQEVEALRVSEHAERVAGFTPVAASVATQEGLLISQLRRLVTTDDAAIDSGDYAPDIAARLKVYSRVFRAPYARSGGVEIALLARLYDVVKDGELLTTDREYMKKIGDLHSVGYDVFLLNFAEYIELRELGAIMTEQDAQADTQARTSARIAAAHAAEAQRAVAAREARLRRFAR